MFLTSGFYSPTTPHTTYPTCMAYSIWGDNFFRFNCPWTNVDISIHCIMSYYTVSITLLLSVPCFSLSCTPLQFVSGQEKPVKHNLQLQKELHLLSKYMVALPVVSHSNYELHFPSTKHCESVSRTFHTLWFWTQNCPKFVLGRCTEIVPRSQCVHFINKELCKPNAVEDIKIAYI